MPSWETTKTYNVLRTYITGQRERELGQCRCKYKTCMGHDLSNGRHIFSPTGNVPNPWIRMLAYAKHKLRQVKLHTYDQTYKPLGVWKSYFCYGMSNVPEIQKTNSYHHVLGFIKSISHMATEACTKYITVKFAYYMLPNTLFDIANIFFGAIYKFLCYQYIKWRVLCIITINKLCV